MVHENVCAYRIYWQAKAEMSIHILINPKVSWADSSPLLSKFETAEPTAVASFTDTK